MKGLLTALIILVLILFGWIYFAPEQVNISKTNQNGTSTSGIIIKNGGKWMVYQDTPLNFSIEYRISPNGYVAVPLRPSEEVVSAERVVGGVSFFGKEDWKEFEESTDPREGPIGITIEVFENVNTETAKEWVQNNTRSNYILPNSGGELSEVVIGGLPAVGYSWSGLYEADAIVVATDQYVYMFSGTYITETDLIRDDFLEFINTFKTLSSPLAYQIF